MANIKGVKLRSNMDLRDMLLAAGIGQFNAQMSIPYMNFLPNTVDPYAQGVLQLVQGLQRLLNKRGSHLVIDGGMGAATLKELAKYAGPRWYDKSFAQLYGDVIAGKRWPGYNREDRAGLSPEEASAEHKADIAGMGDAMGDSVADLVTHPVVLLAAGAAIYWKWFRK
jgi:hypothetical protein